MEDMCSGREDPATNFETERQEKLYKIKKVKEMKAVGIADNERGGLCECHETQHESVRQSTAEIHAILQTNHGISERRKHERVRCVRANTGA